MNTYIEKLKACLEESALSSGETESQTMSQLLYRVYREINTMDTPEISESFIQLNDVLGKLTVRECDRVWDLTCRLCSQHEEVAFVQGIRMGFQLAEEVRE